MVVEGLHGLVTHILASEQFVQFFAHRLEPSTDNEIDSGNGELIFTFQSYVPVTNVCRTRVTFVYACTASVLFPVLSALISF